MWEGEFIGGVIMEEDIKLERRCEKLIDISGIKMCSEMSKKCNDKNESILYHSGSFTYYGCCRYNGREEND